MIRRKIFIHHRINAILTIFRKTVYLSLTIQLRQNIFVTYKIIIYLYKKKNQIHAVSEWRVNEVSEIAIILVRNILFTGSNR